MTEATEWAVRYDGVDDPRPVREKMAREWVDVSGGKATLLKRRVLRGPWEEAS